MSDLGAVWLDDKRCRFRVWAPLSDEVKLHILCPQECMLPMEQKANGYHQVIVEEVLPPLRGWTALSVLSPGLTPWATFCRRFAAKRRYSS